MGPAATSTISSAWAASSSQPPPCFAEILSAGGARVETHVAPRAGHSLTQAGVTQTAQWLRDLTQGEASTRH
jgi:hypothetical protein